ncbi:MAG: hypothetical protein DUD39_10450 [Coriobacteriaceae bacterium]|nr:MAG: hypothetical protein DUD39_10450 [Coriobacteriaceae bacterium]
MCDAMYCRIKPLVAIEKKVRRHKVDIAAVVELGIGNGRVEAIFWWCYMHTESPLPPADIIRVMPTDDEVDGLFATVSSDKKRDDGAPEEYGTGIVWSEFHMPTNYRR